MNCAKNCEFVNRTREHLLHHIKNNIPTKIGYNELDLLPMRNDFLDPRYLYIFDTHIRDCKPMLFMPNDVHDQHESSNAHIQMEDRGNRGEFVYRPYIFGILPDGRKACVVLVNVPIYVDVKVELGASASPDNTDITATAAINATVDKIFCKESLHYKCRDGVHRKTCVEYLRHEVVYMRPFHGFSREPVPYIRIHFNTLYQRVKMLNMLRDRKFATASDDGMDNYFMKLARDFRFNTGNWNRLENYKVVNYDNGCSYTFVVDIKDYQKIKKKTVATYPPFLKELLDKDLASVLTWDIETYRTIQNGMVPTPVDTDYTIFMICAHFGYHWNMNGFADVCFVAAESAVREGMRVTVICDNQDQVIDGFEQIISNMRPEFIATFNGSSFDWPLTLEIMRRKPGRLLQFKQKISCLRMQTTGAYAETDESVISRDFRSETFKINAENKMTLDRVCKIPGMIDVDISPIFRKMYASNEIQLSKSLNFYLAANKLDGKEDMPYTRLFRIYERSLELRTAPQHCHCGDAMANCAVCNHHLNEVDRTHEIVNSETKYTDTFIPALLRDGKLLCCNCGKRPQNLLDMADAGYYCVIDCTRPHQLLVKRTIISEKRQLANMAFVKLFNAFMRADGEKVRNLIGAECKRAGIAFSNAKVNKQDSDKDHYPGAHVFQPNCGLNCTYPVTGLDFSSLYPSIMRAYNITPDMIVHSEAEARKLTAEGYVLEPIGPFNYEKGEKKGEQQNIKMVGAGWSVRHCGIIDSKRDKKITIGYNKHIDASGKPIYDPIYGRDALPGERMGITALIVDKLAAKRAPLKNLNVRLTVALEQAHKEGKHAVEIDGRELSFNDIGFQIDVVNAKQKAIKVLSNTFYGECGNYRSPVYELLVAAGITTHGQYSIKLVGKYVTDLGFKIQYGDTDSLYLVCPDRYYITVRDDYNVAIQKIQREYDDLAPEKQAALDADTARDVEAELAADLERFKGDVNMTSLTGFKREQIYNGEPKLHVRVMSFRAKIKYWEQLVSITMKVMNNLVVEVAEFLMNDNKTRFLVMAYEEVGFPTVFCGKKKYFLKEHLKTIDFTSGAMMVRGIEVVKQGQSPVARRIGYELMYEALSPYNTYTLLQLSERKLRKFYETDWDPLEFAKASTYRPHKKNVAVNTFVGRMKELQRVYSGRTDVDNTMRALYEPPAPGDKFKWIYVKKPQEYTIRGCIIKMKKGDKMEYLRAYYASKETANPLEIDLEEYVESGIKGLMSRFIVYHDAFQPAPGQFDLNNDEGYRSFDNFRVDAASAYLTNFIQNITGVMKHTIRDDGLIYRKQYKTIDRAFKSAINEKYGAFGAVMNHFNIVEEATVARSTLIVDQVLEAAQAQQVGAGVIEGLYEALLNEIGDVFVLRKLYCATGPIVGLCRVKDEILRRDSQAMIDNLRKYGLKFGALIARQQRNIAALLQDMRTTRNVGDAAPVGAINTITTLSEEEQHVIKQVDILRRGIFATYKLLAISKMLAALIESNRTRQMAAQLPSGRLAREDAQMISSIPDYKFN